MGIWKVSSCKYENTKGYFMNYNLFHNNSCQGDAYSFQASFKWLEHLLRIPPKLNLLTMRLSLVCCSLEHMVVNTVRLVASQFSKINQPIFFWFQTVCSCKTQVTAEKNLSPSLRSGFRYSWRETHALQHHWKVSSTSLWDKWQFVNLAKHLVFDLMKIPFLKCLINISLSIVKVLNDQNLLQNQIWLIAFQVMWSSFVQVVIFLEWAEAAW